MRLTRLGVYPAGTLVHLSVLKVFKGTIGEEIIDVQGEEIDCHSVYERGQQYLIYAEGYDKGSNMVRTSLCFGIADMAHSTEDLAYIHQLTNH